MDDSAQEKEDKTWYPSLRYYEKEGGKLGSLQSDTARGKQVQHIS